MMHSGILPTLALLQLGGGAGGGSSYFLVQIVLILGIFYFFLIRPQQQQRKRHEEALRAIKPGDRVVTSGGIIGQIVHIKETTTGEGSTPRSMEDEVTIRSAESRLIVERGRIARIIGGSSAPATKE